VRPRPLPLLVLILALSAAACGGGSRDGDGGPTGATGEATQAQADQAMGGLCDIATGVVTESGDILEAFHTRAHEILHHVASQAQEIDPVVAGAMLEAKSVVESDLLMAPFPSDLPAHAQALVATFADALDTIGLRPASCPSAT